jgi:homoserine kinase
MVVEFVIKIKVPATTANMGAGFDCLGMALNLYNEVAVEESDEFCIVGAVESHSTKDNLIYQVIKRFYYEIGKTPPEIKITQNDNIPMTRGLGSSSACIVAGLLAANELSGKPLSKEEIAQMACQIEGHPDNVAPAVYGGIIIAVLDGDDQKLHHVKITPSDELSFVTFVPDFQLSTAKARRILPSGYSRTDVIYNVSRASLFVASMMSGNWNNLSVSVKDRLHQPFRGMFVPNMDKIFEQAKESGAKGVFMSGAGPTIIAIVSRKTEKKFAEKMKIHLQEFDEAWETKILHADLNGAQIL